MCVLMYDQNDACIEIKLLCFFLHDRNRTFMAFCALLVEAGWFHEIHVCFLPVGHTHGEVDQWFSVISRLKRSRVAGLLSPVQWIDFLRQTGRSASESAACTVEECIVWSARGVKTNFAQHGFVSMMKGFKYLRNFKFVVTTPNVVGQYNVESPLRQGTRSRVCMLFRDEIQPEAKWYGTGGDGDAAIFPLPFVPSPDHEILRYVTPALVLEGMRVNRTSLLTLHINNETSSMFAMMHGVGEGDSQWKRCKGEWNTYFDLVERYAAGESDVHSWTIAELWAVGANIRGCRNSQLSALASSSAEAAASPGSATEPRRPPLEIPGARGSARVPSVRNQAFQNVHLVQVECSLYDWKHGFAGYDVICDRCREPVNEQFTSVASTELTPEFLASPNLDCALCNCTYHLKCITQLGVDQAALTGRWWIKAAHKQLINRAFAASPDVWLVCGKCKPEYNRFMASCCRSAPCKGPVSDSSENDTGTTAGAGQDDSPSSAHSDEERVRRATAHESQTAAAFA